MRMRCPKCSGLLVVQPCLDHFANADTWKCLNCGNIISKKERVIEFDLFGTFTQQQKVRQRK